MPRQFQFPPPGWFSALVLHLDRYWWILNRRRSRCWVVAWTSSSVWVADSPRADSGHTLVFWGRGRMILFFIYTLSNRVMCGKRDKICKILAVCLYFTTENKLEICLV
jgi:hypothetical protein